MAHENMIEELDVGSSNVEQEDDSVNVSSELRNLYRKQKRRTNLMMQKELESKTVIRETTDNIVVQAKLLEQIHEVQSEKNLSDAIKTKDNLLDEISKEYD